METHKKEDMRGVKLLIVLMGLDIGGAETHVLELVKALKSRGLEIFVASNGGVYENELISHGIQHFKVPLHNKRPASLITSYNALKRIIIDHDIRLVHAHARIPAFICGLLRKRLDFAFVTTAHLNFNTSIHYKVLTNWGDMTLAVSQDIYEYLIENYSINGNQIIVSVNGINTKTFHADIDYSDITAEFSLDNTKKRIVYMSRLDKDRSLPAHKLIDIAEEIHGKNENTEIVIVGDGDDFASVSKKAEIINHALGKPYIKLAGSRIDTAKFLASADIFIGVSRSAMEAMACKKPIILAGNQGYIGIFDKTKLEAAVSTNFCCRGHEDVSENALRQDIFALLDASPAKLAELGEYGKELIDEAYSIERMADDALRLYDGVRSCKKPIDTLIAGYYGSNNHGDDALLKSIVDDLQARRNLSISVISRRPKETHNLYNVNTIHKFNFPKILRSLKRTNLLIMGGGSLIQDFTSTKSLIYYVFLINMAAKFGAKTMLYANGIGPLNHEKNKKRAVSALKKVDKITLRDNASKDVLEKLGLTGDTIEVTADAAFRFSPSSVFAGDELLTKIGLANKEYFCISVRGWRNLKDDFAYELATFCDYIYENHGLLPLFIPMQPSIDTEIATSILDHMNCRGYFLNLQDSKIIEIQDMLAIIQKAKFLVGMRLHSIIYAATVATPILGLVYDPKVRAIFRELEQDQYLTLEKCTCANLIKFAEEIIANRDKISLELTESSANLSQLAERNVDRAYEILDRNLF